eukprot:CAMPEP_0179442620 /NCGR_PEP_ID=MMETSP0799-20121207/26117_1 /TAXON_ID=46947 /ORGANISM="Geminigera cryophila, Strain CCMP2564" /LENGTH=120 /DNA_ID=CAMNT_0021227947 /DNA_START=791 /DNA_END=1153 /DNA_ORIENTATION=+
MVRGPGALRCDASSAVREVFQTATSSILPLKTRCNAACATLAPSTFRVRATVRATGRATDGGLRGAGVMALDTSEPLREMATSPSWDCTIATCDHAKRGSEWLLDQDALHLSHEHVGKTS